MSGSEKPKDPSADLKGTTLRVYMQILRNKKTNEPIGVREIQRAMNFSSPTLARYHLGKLQELGLMKQNEDGSYALIKEVRVDILEPFIKLGAHIIPRLVAYAVMVSILLAYLLAVAIPSGNAALIQFSSIATGGVAAISLWYETVRSWKSAPK
jgi:DNA-binding transcriptional ArsR family regulator